VGITLESQFIKEGKAVREDVMFLGCQLFKETLTDELPTINVFKSGRRGLIPFQSSLVVTVLTLPLRL